MSDVILELLKIYGPWAVVAVVVIMGAVWTITHWAAKPGERVSVIWKLVEYTKGEKPNQENSSTAHSGKRQKNKEPFSEQLPETSGEVESKVTVHAPPREKLEVQPPEGMVLVPKGPFHYGKERKRETIDHDYWIDVYPVTNKKYREFILGNGYKNQAYWFEEWWKWKTEKNINAPRMWSDPGWNQPDHPVVCVSYYEAEAYAKFVGKRLPTEQEWEKAARGTDGRTFPWGYGFDDSKCNQSSTSWFAHYGTSPVTKYPDGLSPFGCYEMAGNVKEWCSTWYNEEQNERVFRGGSFADDSVKFQSSYRNGDNAAYWSLTLGFRLAQDGSVANSLMC